MKKLYGTKIVMTGSRDKEFVHWYSTDKETSDKLTECAKGIQPPYGTAVNFTPIEADVILTDCGIYELDDGKTVSIETHSPGAIIMHGYRIVGGKVKQNRPVAFYLNGEPSSHAARETGARIVKQLRARI